MISEQDKQAILNGAYGVTRDGCKAKLVFTSNFEKNNSPYLFVYEETEYESYSSHWLNSKFCEGEEPDSEYDIVGLWQDKPEPFDLDRALAGEPVMIRDGSKGYVFTNLNNIAFKEDINCDNYLPLRGVIIYENNGKKLSLETWELNGKTTNNGEEDHYDIIGMWKEPEPVSNTVTLTLPCPLKEPKEGMWFLTIFNCIGKSYFNSNNLNEKYNEWMLEEGHYFDSKEDAQAWLDAMKNNRR